MNNSEWVPYHISKPVYLQFTGSLRFSGFSFLDSFGEAKILFTGALFVMWKRRAPFYRKNKLEVVACH